MFSEKSYNIKARNFGLDLFRAVAILLVVAGHGGVLLKDTRFDGFPYYRMIDGVDLFFVLSGFLIGGILIRQIESGNRFGVSAISEFWKRRWLRTLPNYYLVLLINYILLSNQLIEGDLSQLNYKFLFFLQNFSSPFYGFFWESWSLGIEEWFYFLFPIFLMLLLRFCSSSIAFLITTMAMIMLPVVYRISIMNPTIDAFWYDVTFRKVTLARLDSIAYGLLAAWIFHKYKSWWNWISVPSFIGGVCLIIGIVQMQSFESVYYKQIWVFTLTPIAVMMLLPFSYRLPSPPSWIHAPITHISKISYSMYLINLGLICSFLKVNFSPMNGFKGMIMYLLYWILVIVISSLIYRYFEKPITDLRDRTINRNE